MAGAALWWEENMTRALVTPATLPQLLPYMAKIESEDRRNDRYDPITATVITFLTCPLQLGLTEVGALLFHGRSTLLYPYALMSEPQRDFVREALRRSEEWNIYNGVLSFRRSGPPIHLDPADVLLALCRKVFESAAHPEEARRVALCNIILQRVQGYVRIDKPVQQALNDWLRGARGSTPSASGC